MDEGVDGWEGEFGNILNLITDLPRPDPALNMPPLCPECARGRAIALSRDRFWKQQPSANLAFSRFIFCVAANLCTATAAQAADDQEGMGGGLSGEAVPRRLPRHEPTATEELAKSTKPAEVKKAFRDLSWGIIDLPKESHRQWLEDNPSSAVGLGKSTRLYLTKSCGWTTTPAVQWASKNRRGSA
jgi:hypothetical protein